MTLSGDVFQSAADDQSIAKTMGGRITQLREKAGMSLTELAQKAAINQDVLGLMENNKSGMSSSEKLEKIATALDTSIVFLLTGTEPVEQKRSDPILTIRHERGAPYGFRNFNTGELKIA